MSSVLSVASRVPSMPDLTPLPSPVMGSSMPMAVWTHHQHPPVDSLPATAATPLSGQTGKYTSDMVGMSLTAPSVSADSHTGSGQVTGLARKRSVSFSSSLGLRRRSAREVEPVLHRELHLILADMHHPVLISPIPASPVFATSFFTSPVVMASTARPNEDTASSGRATHPSSGRQTNSDGQTTSTQNPTDGRSTAARHDSAVSSDRASDRPSSQKPTVARPAAESMEQAEKITVPIGPDGNPASYQLIRLLGKGTFSNVMLGLDSGSDTRPAGQLVAVKIVALQPAGGASEERVELGLQREVDIIKSLDHPSIVKLHAFDLEQRPDGQAIIILDYCRGGDLFELASQHPELLTAGMVRRIFAELVDAVRYLHQSWIVHRDIKLENILVNYAFDELPADPIGHSRPLIALTDLGLSRRIPEPPTSVMLTTRCGSEDYAAPEILLSQPYDGRATDAWACGVVLYALMETRLPFDPPARGRGARSPLSHRIAKCEWSWRRFADEHGQWAEADSSDELAWRGGRDIVAGLLRKADRGRTPLDQVASSSWLCEGMKLPTTA